MVTSKYFKEAEFQRCSPACSLQDMKQDFMLQLDFMREAAGIPLVLNSAYRSATYEKQQKRTGTSAHTLGCAVDIQCNTDQNRWKIVNAALAVGFTRIGISNTFVHVDNSRSHTKDVVWLY